MSIGNDGRKGSGFISIHEVEWGCSGHGMRLVIVRKFCGRESFCPRERVVLAEDMEVGFKFFVDVFSFSIGLWVISSGQGQGISKELS